MELKRNKIRLSEWYYLIVMIGYSMTLVSGKVRPGILASALLILIAGQIVINRDIRLSGTIDCLMADRKSVV